MATDSSQMENDQRIWTNPVRIVLLSTPRTYISRQERKRKTHFEHRVTLREENGQHRAEAEKILYLERVQLRVVCRLVLVQHEVDRIRGEGDEEDLERGVVQRDRERGEEI